MNSKERKRNEQRIEDALRELFGRHLVSIEFEYYRGGREISVTYEDFKPYAEARALICEVLQGKWMLFLHRNYSNERIKNALFDMYNLNRVAVVDVENGNLKPYTIRNYIYGLMDKK